MNYRRGGNGPLELLELRQYQGETYSNPQMNATMGAGDRVIVHCLVNEASGTSPTVTVRAEDSSDGENWTEVGSSPVIGSFSVGGQPEMQRGVVEFPHARFLRFKVEVGGTNPAATLSLRASIKNA